MNFNNLVNLSFICFCFIGCDFDKSSVLQMQPTTENKILKVFISSDESIIIGNDTIDYCRIEQELNSRLSSINLAPRYLRLYPDSSLDMIYVHCVIEKTKNAAIDSLGLGKLGSDFILNVKNDSIRYDESPVIVVHVINNREVIVSNDTVEYSSMKTKISNELYKYDAALIRYSTQGGVSYKRYLLNEGILNSVKEEFSDKMKVEVQEHGCPYCLH